MAANELSKANRTSSFEKANVREIRTRGIKSKLCSGERVTIKQNALFG